MHDLEFLDFVADFLDPATVEAYDELPLWSAMFGLMLLENVPLMGVTIALDVGCGTGFPLIELAERLGPATHVHGIDPWAAGLLRAGDKIRLRRTPNVTLHEGTASTMPFERATFDLIVSNLGVNNFDNPEASLRECRRVARTGATLALTTNLQGHMQEFYDVFNEVLEEHRRDSIEPLRDHIAHRATVPGLTTLLTNAGFGVNRVLLRTETMRFASGTALMNHHFIKLGFLEGWKKIVTGDQKVVFHQLLVALDRQAVSHSGLTLTIPMAYVEATAV